MKKIPFFLLAILLAVTSMHAQQTSYTQVLRGVVYDNLLQQPVGGAAVTLMGSGLTVTTDDKGTFRFNGVPVTPQQILVTHISFRSAALENIVVISGKETVVNVALEPNIAAEKEVVVKASGRKNRPLNELSAVSARAFTVEETQKYAAAVNDPLRMATGLAGVMAPDDGNNSIVIRGNSPTGLLWRMEGLDIPNPNHFGSTGSSGGGISILSSQLLANSDFITGAFAAEYGNALSGVFDLHLRKGNNEKREYTLQAGVLGLNAAAEGPISAFYKGSYLINYRYSTLQLLSKAGLVENGGSTNFQDLSYNIYLPTHRLGNFTLFGFGGLSGEHERAELDPSKWDGSEGRYDSRFTSNTGMTGLTHSIALGAQTTLKSAVGVSFNKILDDIKYATDELTLTDEYRDAFKTRKWTATTALQHRVNNRSFFRTGVIVNLIRYRYYQLSGDHLHAPLEEVINTKGNTSMLQAYGQYQYKVSPSMTLSGGLHFMQLGYNNTRSVEPRASVRWQATPRTGFALGYGLHSQAQPLGVYFAKMDDGNGGSVSPNKDLGFTKAHHVVASVSHRVTPKFNVRTEVYYQHLFKVPISTYDTSSFSALNVESEYVTDPLVNKGKGKNYGLEISLERYLADNYYFSLSNSFYQSKYTAADGKERDTRFNGKYILSLLAGKEFLSDNKLRTFGINLKTIYAGGYRRTPIDLQRSLEVGYAIYDESNAYTIQNPAYFRADLRLSVKWNRKNFTTTLSLDIQNLTNRQNIYNQWFEAEKGEVVTSYQTGLIPVLNYKIEF